MIQDSISLSCKLFEASQWHSDRMAPAWYCANIVFLTSQLPLPFKNTRNLKFKNQTIAAFYTVAVICTLSEPVK